MTDGTRTVPLASQRVDPRITRTRAALIRALSTLVSETPKGETISMSAVAQRAGLSRQALHNHYSNVGDLATDLWISRLLEDWLPSTRPRRTSHRPSPTPFGSAGSNRCSPRDVRIAASSTSSAPFHVASASPRYSQPR